MNVELDEASDKSNKYKKLLSLFTESNGPTTNLYENVNYLAELLTKYSPLILEPIKTINSKYLANIISRYTNLEDLGENDSNNDARTILQNNRVAALGCWLTADIHGKTISEMLQSQLQLGVNSSLYKEIKTIPTIGEVFKWPDIKYIEHLNSYNMPIEKLGRSTFEIIISSFIKMLEENFGENEIYLIKELQEIFKKRSVDEDFIRKIKKTFQKATGNTSLLQEVEDFFKEQSIDQVLIKEVTDLFEKKHSVSKKITDIHEFCYYFLKKFILFINTLYEALIKMVLEFYTGLSIITQSIGYLATNVYQTFLENFSGLDPKGVIDQEINDNVETIFRTKTDYRNYLQALEDSILKIDKLFPERVPQEIINLIAAPAVSIEKFEERSEITSIRVDTCLDLITTAFSKEIIKILSRCDNNLLIKTEQGQTINKIIWETQNFFSEIVLRLKLIQKTKASYDKLNRELVDYQREEITESPFWKKMKEQDKQKEQDEKKEQERLKNNKEDNSTDDKSSGKLAPKKLEFENSPFWKKTEEQEEQKKNHTEDSFSQKPVFLDSEQMLKEKESHSLN